MKELCRRIQDYYYYEPVGGALHIVLDDGNVEDHHIHWCLENSISEAKDEEAEYIANELLKLTESEREKLYDNNWEIY